jgi:hypothetical protein
VSDDPYAYLVELTERELELALAGDAEGLYDLQRTREAAMAEMPSRAPESARGLIGLAARLQLDVTRALAEQLKGAAGEIRRLEGGRTSIRRYGGQAPSPALVDRAG